MFAAGAKRNTEFDRIELDSRALALGLRAPVKLSSTLARFFALAPLAAAATASVSPPLARQGGGDNDDGSAGGGGAKRLGPTPTPPLPPRATIAPFGRNWRT